MTSGNSSSSSAEHLADREVRRRCVAAGGVAQPSFRSKKTRRNLPICSSSPWRSTHPVDPLLVDVGAVERAGVGRDVALGRPFDVDVASRHGDVVEADLAVGVAAESGQLVVEEKRSPACSPGRTMSTPISIGQVADGHDEVVVGAGRVLERIDRGERDRAIVERVERRAAAGAERCSSAGCDARTGCRRRMSLMSTRQPSVSAR